jgi:hypothetical protein
MSPAVGITFFLPSNSKVRPILKFAWLNALKISPRN